VGYLDDLFSATETAYEKPGSTGAYVSAAVTISPSSNPAQAATPGPIKFGYASLAYTPAEKPALGGATFGPPPYLEGPFQVTTETFEGFSSRPQGSLGQTTPSTAWRSVKISAPVLDALVTDPQSTYRVHLVDGSSFIPSVDAATNVLYGVADGEFFVISLSGPASTPAGEPPPK
jgi:hypothetical protein